MARKAASFQGSTGITSSSRNKIDKLPIHKRMYVKARAEGATVEQAANSVGVSRRQGQNYEKDSDIQGAYRLLMRQAVPAEKLVKLIRGGCEAKMPVYGADGKKRGERADWKTRKGYIEMAAKHGGYHEDKATPGSGTSINLTVNHIGQPHQGVPVDGTRSQRIIEASAQAN